MDALNLELRTNADRRAPNLIGTLNRLLAIPKPLTSHAASAITRNLKSNMASGKFQTRELSVGEKYNWYCRKCSGLSLSGRSLK
jgi:hypothetical protein